MDLGNNKLILSSGSPRRQNLLKEAQIDFELRVIETDESFPDALAIDQVAGYIAQKKAEAHQETIQPYEIVLTADTVVCKDNIIYGKPKSKEEALEMLLAFSNDTHEVYTGVCLFSKEKMMTKSFLSEVTFAPISKDEVLYYIELDNPMDKAGAYGIQDWIGRCKVKSIKGSYTNIMGLPVPQVVEMLESFMQA
ncbi:MAG: septum formation protein Maf [Saprospiraceae bacterium]|nr:septum formation protein Maf [Bacteroidia bacterium]NNL93970.1 septum formation protein Maf [Saprospiraceae bacterium]